MRMPMSIAKCRMQATVVAILTSGTLHAVDVGPLEYLQRSDSPFADQAFEYFHLEDLEDGMFNVPGASFTPAWGIRSNSTFTDSVDGDDGILDGFGRDGASLSSFFAHDHFTVNFDIGVLGALPTHVGIVWTDAGRNGGGNPVSFPLPVTFELNL